MSKPTPGPWKTGVGGVWSTVNHYVAITVIDPDSGIDAETRDANARLIASAPDLLEALRELVEGAECYCLGPGEGPIGQCGYCIGREAIAKATGKE